MSDGVLKALSDGVLLSVRCERKPGHFWADNEVLDKFGSEIGAYGLSIYMVLSRYARNDTGKCQLSNRVMAEKLGISTERVRKSLGVLQKVGLITIFMPENPRCHVAATYTLLAVRKSGHRAPTNVGAQHPDGGAGHPEAGAWRPINKEERLKDLQTNSSRSAPLSQEEVLQVEAVYVAYPRKVGKVSAIKAIEKAADSLVKGKNPQFATKLDALLFLEERARVFAGSTAGQRGHLTPYPATWFGRGSYLDDPEEWNQLDSYELKDLKRRQEANVGVYRPA